MLDEHGIAFEYSGACHQWCDCEMNSSFILFKYPLYEEDQVENTVLSRSSGSGSPDSQMPRQSRSRSSGSVSGRSGYRTSLGSIPERQNENAAKNEAFGGKKRKNPALGN